MASRRSFLNTTTLTGIASIIAAGIPPAFAKERQPKSGVTLDEAWALHRKCLIIDGHQDTSVRRFSRKEDPKSWMNRDMSYHCDIPRLTENGQKYVGLFLIEDSSVTDLWTITEFILKEIDEHPDTFMLVLSSKDAVQAGKKNKVGVILEIEGPAMWLNGNINIVHLLYRLGLRDMHITHGEGGSEPHFLQGTRSISARCSPADRENQRRTFTGLTVFGREVVKTNDELGIITDLSHTNDKTYFDVIELTTKPPIMSHTGVFSLSNHYRCLTDDQIKALASKGGVMGIVVLPGFIDADPQKATVDRIVDHIAYVGDLVGMDYVGFGSDYDGFSDPPIIPEVSQLVLLTQAMMSRGFSEEEIKKFWGGNFLRVMEQTIDKPGKA